MNNREFSDNFDVLLNSYDSKASFGDEASKQEISLNEYEKSVFLSMAEEDVVKSYIDRTLNQQAQGFDDSMRRQVDYSSLITIANLQPLISKKESEPVLLRRTVTPLLRSGVTLGPAYDILNGFPVIQNNPDWPSTDDKVNDYRPFSAETVYISSEKQTFLIKTVYPPETGRLVYNRTKSWISVDLININSEPYYKITCEENTSGAERTGFLQIEYIAYGTDRGFYGNKVEIVQCAAGEESVYVHIPTTRYNIYNSETGTYNLYVDAMRFFKDGSPIGSSSEAANGKPSYSYGYITIAYSDFSSILDRALNGDVSYEITYPSGVEPWCSLVVDKYGMKVVPTRFEENDVRSCTLDLTVVCGDEVETYQVEIRQYSKLWPSAEAEQSAAQEPPFLIQSSSHFVELNAPGGTATLEITSDDDFNVPEDSVLPSWVTVTKTIVSTKKIRYDFVIKQNNDDDTRSTWFGVEAFKSEGTGRAYTSFLIKQFSYGDVPVITINPNILIFDADPNSPNNIAYPVKKAKVTVRSGYKWTLNNSGNPWTTAAKTSSGDEIAVSLYGNDQLNTSKDPRYAPIKVSAWPEGQRTEDKTIVEYLTVEQLGAEYDYGDATPSISATPNKLVFSSNGGAKEINVTYSNSAPPVVDNKVGNWFTCGWSNDNVLKVVCSENTSYTADNTGSFDIIAKRGLSSATVSITVIQNKKTKDVTPPVITPTSITFPPAGGKRIITCSNASSCDFGSIPSGSFFAAEKMSSTQIEVTCDANETTSSKTGTFIITAVNSAGSVSQEISIELQPTDQPAPVVVPEYMNIDKDSLIFKSHGFEHQVIKIYSNYRKVVCEPATSDDEWLRCSYDSDTSTCEVWCRDNETEEKRTGTILIEGEGDSDGTVLEVTITQDVYPSVTILPNYLKFNASENNYQHVDIQVTGAINTSIISSDVWISKVPTETGIDVNVYERKETRGRTGYIRVTAVNSTGEIVEKDIIIEQSGASQYVEPEDSSQEEDPTSESGNITLYDDRSLAFRLPKRKSSKYTETAGTTDVLFILQEKLLVKEKNDQFYSSYTIKPISYTEYDRLMSKAYASPLKRQAWRLFQNQSTGFDILSEIIPANAVNVTNSDIVYRIRYVRRPKPIILEDLPDGLQIDGYTKETTCEINPILHQDILARAVQLALASKGRQTNSTEKQ